MITDSGHPAHFYLTRDAGVSWDMVNITQETGQEVYNVKERFGGKAVRYGGIYSYEGTDKE